MTDHVYKSLELTGSSTKSSDDAVRVALERGAGSIRGIKWFEVTDQRGHVENGKVAHWQVTIKAWFTLES